MKKKTVLITGGTRGIGKETALEFLSNDFNVIITSRYTKEDELKKIFPVNNENLYLYTLDVTKEEQVKAVIEKIISKFKSLDVLVNNAGISLSNGILTQSLTSDFEKMINTNILGTYYCMKYSLLHMEKEGKGSIINISSITGLRGIPYSVLYGSTKSAIIGLTKGSAIEYANSGIRINAVAPGIIKTEELQREFDTGEVDEEAISSFHPTQTLGQVKDVAKGVYFLADDSNSFLTGHILNIDGGYTAQ